MCLGFVSEEERSAEATLIENLNDSWSSSVAATNPREHWG